jgi:putative DNA methylase
MFKPEITPLLILHQLRDTTVQDPATHWRVPLAPSWVISKNYTTVAELVPNARERRFDILLKMDADRADFEAAANGTVDGDSNVIYTIDGRKQTRALTELRGDVDVLSESAYADKAEGRARALARHARCRNRYSDTSANDLRLWEPSDVVPRADDLFQERLYAIHWVRPDGSFMFTEARADDLVREEKVIEFVQSNLNAWKAAGLVPQARIDPGDKTDEPIRTRGWTYWHHLFDPRSLLIGASLATNIRSSSEPLVASLGQCRALARMGRLCRWYVGNTAKPGVAQASDRPMQVFSNQALNTWYNFACRAWPDVGAIIDLDFNAESFAVTSDVAQLAAAQVETRSDIWITDPPYADAVRYHEITEYFIAWVANSPPRSDWVWDSRRSLAVQGEGQSFKRVMVDAFAAKARNMPDNGFQVVMFTHQDVGVWADLAEILWAAGLHVTAGWCIATETESATRSGNYVQGTVLLILRKREGQEAGFIARLQRPVEQAVQDQLKAMRDLDEGEDPNFGDADYQLAAYAAALKVLTRYASIDGRPVASEVLRERSGSEETDVVRLLKRARRLASDFLVPAEFPRQLWTDLTPEERFYVKGLEMEKEGEARNSAFQELARGFGVDHKPFLGSRGANEARLKTARELGTKDLKRAGGKDRAETAELDGFALSLVRHTLYGVHLVREEDGNFKVALDWFARNFPNYWQRQSEVAKLLDYLATIKTSARAEEADMARDLKGAITNHRP